MTDEWFGTRVQGLRGFGLLVCYLERVWREVRWFVQGTVREKKDGNDFEVELEDGTIEVVSRSCSHTLNP